MRPGEMSAIDDSHIAEPYKAEEAFGKILSQHAAAQDRCLYLGMTSHPKDRWSSHSRKSAHWHKMYLICNAGPHVRLAEKIEKDLIEIAFAECIGRRVGSNVDISQVKIARRLYRRYLLPRVMQASNRSCWIARISKRDAQSVASHRR